MPSRRHLRGSAVLAALTLVLGGCWLSPEGVGTPTPSPGRSATPTPTAERDEDVPKELAPFYDQDVAWTACDTQFECATFEVPMDYAEPGGETVTIAAKRLPAAEPGKRLGSLVMNPGGPGVSAMPYIDAAQEYFSQAVLDAYDIVGFDPRGVGLSTDIVCVDAARIDELRAAVYDKTTQAGLDEYRADNQEFADACEEQTGPILAYVDTVSATRDMDVLRAVLGEDQLTYIGFSYGSKLGATYAELFPERSGRLVLDGALDPAVGYTELAIDQAQAFEAGLRAYAADCLQTQGCPLTGDVDAAVGQIGRFLELLVGSPLPTGTDRPLTQALAVSGLLYALYDDILWPVLTESLSSAMQHDDGSALLFLADFSAEREPDGSYSSNSWSAFQAITCLDYPVDASPEAMQATADRLDEVAPTLGEFFSYGEILCDVWPVAPVGEPGPLHGEGAAPILVIGTTGDPATPYHWAEAMADELESARLLTYEGQGHTAYGRSNECVTEAVDGFLIDGALPPEGLVC